MSRYQPCLVEQIVSGGQTGADRAALNFALQHGIPHGGWCPLGRLAEDGAIGSEYLLQETPTADYAQRTEWNVRDSDATAVFSVSRDLTGGSATTMHCAHRLGRPFLHLSRSHQPTHAATLLRQFVDRHRVRVLNIAGPRESEEPAIGTYVSDVLTRALLGSIESRNDLHQ